MLAKVDLPHAGVIHDGGRVTVGENLALIDDGGVVTDAKGLANVVIRDENPDAAVSEVANDALDLDDGNGIDPSKWLIEQNKAWLGGQCPGDLDAPSLPARECLTHAVPNAGDL